MVKRIVLLSLTLTLFFQCKPKGNQNNQSHQTGFTNIADQEYIMISQEFDTKNYDKVIDYVDKFFKENSLKEENVKLLNLKAEAKARLANQLKDSKKYKDRIEKYGFKIIKNRVVYGYEEYITLWEEFPETEYGKAAFLKMISISSNVKDRIDYYKKYMDLIKDKIHLDSLKYELSKIYLTDYKKYITELIKLYNDLMPGEYKEDVILNYYIIKFKLDKDFESYRNNLKSLILEKNSNAVLANYLLGDLTFIENNLDEAKKYYGDAKNQIKNVKEKQMGKGMVISFGIISDVLMEKIKMNIVHKLVLIDKVLSYRKNLIDKNFAIVNGERVRVRKDPVVVRNNVVTTLNYGDRVILIKKKEKADKIDGEESYWYFVQLMDNTSGWIFGKYLMFFTY